MKHYTCVDSVGNISTAPKDRQKSNRYGTQDCLNRLFSYEATGFEPEQVTALIESNKELTEENARLEKENEWIPVEERLPEKPKQNPDFEGKPLQLYMVQEKTMNYPFRAFWNGEFFSDGWSKVNIDVWKPLQPYKESEKQ